jgi:hypothetical protein
MKIKLTVTETAISSAYELKILEVYQSSSESQSPTEIVLITGYVRRRKVEVALYYYLVDSIEIEKDNIQSIRAYHINAASLASLLKIAT